jgi:hypothetical protein
LHTFAGKLAFFISTTFLVLSGIVLTLPRSVSLLSLDSILPFRLQRHREQLSPAIRQNPSCRQQKSEELNIIEDSAFFVGELRRGSDTN